GQSTRARGRHRAPGAYVLAQYAARDVVVVRARHQPELDQPPISVDLQQADGFVVAAGGLLAVFLSVEVVAGHDAGAGDDARDIVRGAHAGHAQPGAAAAVVRVLGTGVDLRLYDAIAVAVGVVTRDIAAVGAGLFREPAALPALVG